jgi:hypothetical protein
LLLMHIVAFSTLGSHDYQEAFRPHKEVGSRPL